MRQAAVRLGRGGDLGSASDLAGDGTDVSFQDWHEDDSNRFVQFSFNPEYFDVDLPNTTLWPAEAAEILERHRGFFYVKDRRQFEHPAENVPDFIPLRRVYVYGDEWTAAEDMAFVWFDVWKFPVDWRFYVMASAFHDGHGLGRRTPAGRGHRGPRRLNSGGRLTIAGTTTPSAALARAGRRRSNARCRSPTDMRVPQPLVSRPLVGDLSQSAVRNLVSSAESVILEGHRKEFCFGY